MVNETSISLLKEVMWLDNLLNARIIQFYDKGAEVYEEEVRETVIKGKKEKEKPPKEAKVVTFTKGANPMGGPPPDGIAPEQLDYYGMGGVSGFGEYPKCLADDVPPPDLSADNSFFANFVKEHQLSPQERAILILIVAPHIFPEVFEKLLSLQDEQGNIPISFGLMIHPEDKMCYPSVQTVFFILYGSTFFNFDLFQDLSAEGKLVEIGVMELDEISPKESRLTQRIYPTPDFMDSLLHGRPTIPRFGADFPAKRIQTPLEWEDLVLPNNVVSQLDEIHTWLEFHDTLMQKWGMKRKLKPGYRALFYGPPGTGKTLTAALLGKTTGKPVFRIDLSMIVSKFIGETEKNLSRVFDAAEKKDWILFFDEADALFGKRTKVSDSHDRYANQEVSYLLQRVEEYAGLVILATNLKSNLDDAFTRRFQTIVHFPMPQAEERLRHWEDGISDMAEIDPEINLRQVAAKYELSGGAILNIIQYASLMALKQGDGVIRKKDLIEGIRREFSKEGRTI